MSSNEPKDIGDVGSQSEAERVAQELGVPTPELCGHFESHAERVACIGRGNHNQVSPMFAEFLRGFEHPPVGATPAAGRPSFEEWWTQLVKAEAPTIQRKAEEYGTNSLVEMGRLFAKAQGWQDITEPEAIEVGCFLYAFGKMQRVADAMLKGRLPNLDSWHDLMIYSAMSNYTRTYRAWP